MIASLRRPFVIAVALAACGQPDSNSPGGGQPGGPGSPVPVEVATAFADTVVDAIVATGQVEALQQIELRPDVEGRVVDLMFTEGARVTQGTPLLKIDDAELKAQVERARADRDLAKQSLDRTTQLLAEKAAATAELEQAGATARSSQASLDLLELRLGRTVVRAPFSGVIGQRLVSLGDYVNSSSRLLTLQTVSPQRIVFSVPERYASALKVRQRVAFQVAALTGKSFEARVDFVDPVVTLPGRTIMVKALADNSQGSLQPGMFIEARLATEVRPSAIVIPEEAVAPTAAASWVWVVEGDKVTRREVELGVRSPGFVEVRKGIDLGDRVVVGGLDQLMPGASVKATEVVRRPQGAREP